MTNESHFPKTSLRTFLLCGALLCASLALILVSQLETAQARNPTALRALSNSFAEIADTTSPAVVFIQAEARIPQQDVAPPDMEQFFPPELFERFFGRRFPTPEPRPQAPRGDSRRYDQILPRGTGTGFIIEKDGYIITNNHVVEGADRLRVRLTDGREFDGEIVGTDPATEVAVIKIDADDLPTLPLGDSDSLRVGEWVMAIGNPFGLSHSVTAGIVSAKGRSNVGITDYADFIQTDAAINPGNSGGPLLNLDGEVIGINTAIFTRTGGYMGIGFAIPVNMARNVKDQLIDSGRVTRGFLGVLIQDITPDIAEWFDIDNGSGILVGDVSEDSPAEHAGLEREDLILELDGEAIDDVAAFRNQIAMTPPGTKSEVLILRDGKHVTKTVTLGTRDEEPVLEQPDDAPSDYEELGLGVQNLTPQLAERFGYSDQSGVIVIQVAPNSGAARAGIRPGTLIEEVNREPVRTTAELREALGDGESEKSLLLSIREGESRRYVALKFNR